MNFYGIDICCPHCRGELERAASAGDRDALRCLGCERGFPVLAGIPDLRVFPDPYIDLESDRVKGLGLAALWSQLTFEQLVEYYYQHTSVVPPHHAQLYSRGLLAAPARAAGALDAWIAESSITDADEKGLLDVGCGTAPFLVAAARRFRSVVGIDVAFRWLVVARKRLDEAGLRDVPLICACAESLPFRDGAFDVVAAESAVEVLKDQAAALGECRRVTRGAGGHLWLSTSNRYSIAPDPHTGIWAGTWLPERVTAAIVRRQGGIPPKRKLLSSRAVKRLMRGAGFVAPRVSLPDIPDGQRECFGSPMRLAIDAYRLARRTPLARHLLSLVGPLLCATATTGARRVSTTTATGAPTSHPAPTPQRASAADLVARVAPARAQHASSTTDS